MHAGRGHGARRAAAHAGVIPIGKTNVPEFGMGSHTYNKVYGTTREPLRPDEERGRIERRRGRRARGGNAADRQRQRPGRIAAQPGQLQQRRRLSADASASCPTRPTRCRFVGFAVKGPMARTVDDIALLLSVMAGPDPRDPALLPIRSGGVSRDLDRDFEGVRVAWCPDLGGLPLDRGCELFWTRSGDVRAARLRRRGGVPRSREAPTKSS